MKNHMQLRVGGHQTAGPHAEGVGDRFGLTGKQFPGTQRAERVTGKRQSVAFVTVFFCPRLIQGCFRKVKPLVPVHRLHGGVVPAQQARITCRKKK